MASQHVRYAEVTFSPSTHQFSLGIPFDTYFEGLTRGRLRAKSEFGVEIRWVFDIVRDIPDRELNRLRAEYTVAVALEGMKDGVVALGLGGAEVDHPPKQYGSKKPLQRGCTAPLMLARRWDRQVSGEPYKHWARNVSDTACVLSKTPIS